MRREEVFYHNCLIIQYLNLVRLGNEHMRTYYFQLLVLVAFYIINQLGQLRRLVRLERVKHSERRFQQLSELVFFLHTFCYGGTVDLHLVRGQNIS